jgi:hypothetical protein
MLKRFSIAPFEAAIALLLIISGITSIMKYGVIDPVTSLLPGWEALTFNILSIVSGLCLIVGISTGRGKIEQAGLLFLTGIIIGRFLLFGDLLGYGAKFIQTGIFDLSVILASFVRWLSIRRGHIIVRLKEDDFERSS